MTAIMHRVVIEAEPKTVFEALTTGAGLSAWWTKAEAKPELGSQAIFHFGPTGGMKVCMQITDLQENALVVWDCVEGPWDFSEAFIFKLSEDERGTALEFANTGWPEMNAFYQHCNCKWGLFLGLSLKSYLEKGEGYPSPKEPQV
jgi:uncharacterized protein YndB with AHSA1/START domain